jgi:hypothetical protein
MEKFGKKEAIDTCIAFINNDGGMYSIKLIEKAFV